MASLIQMSSASRKPFSSLNVSRVRDLSSLKNRQNSSSTNSSPSKRRYDQASDLSDNDNENIDPEFFKSPAKRGKNDAGHPIKPLRSSQFVMTNTPSNLSKSYSNSPVQALTPKLDTQDGVNRRKSMELSAPAPAGRSPKNKRMGHLSRRKAGSPFTRIDPPSYRGLRRSQNSAPFSIDAALSGTISSYEPKPTRVVKVPILEESVPKGWVFDIHEDTPDEEMANIMEHSTYTLDISDDEGRNKNKNDRGKENVPPMDELASSIGARSVPAGSLPSIKIAAVSRKDMMTDETRTPLGDLNAADYYAEGCDASSYVIVSPSKADNESVEGPLPPAENEAKKQTVELTETVAEPTASAMSVANILANVNTGKEDAKPECPTSKDCSSEKPMEEIEIWESDSATDERVEEQLLKESGLFVPQESYIAI
ncbi:MAG: hypothetical protein M1834_005031 [Cirrosporium novae-zelandiae]|nr:MAG: hypothetical protein M1834_005031 [Cirrosporium novae-zelandiae]